MKTELIEIGSTVRVESGPARLTATATAEMEPDRDADGRPLVPNNQTRRVVLEAGAKLAAHYKLELIDAMGKRIVDGQQFTYLGYFDDTVWYTYQLKDVDLDDGLAAKLAARNKVALDDLTVEMVADWFSLDPSMVTDGGRAIKRFMPVGDPKKTKDEALKVAHKLEVK